MNKDNYFLIIFNWYEKIRNLYLGFFLSKYFINNILLKISLITNKLLNYSLYRNKYNSFFGSYFIRKSF